MVRERKTKIIDIEKLHELIDSASLPKERTASSYDNEKLDTFRKRLSDESLKKPKKFFSSDIKHTTSESLKPLVVVRKREEIQKKEEKIIQIDLGPKEIKKQKEDVIVDFIPLKEDLFVGESLYEVEKVTVQKEEFTKEKTIKLLKK
jgi:hypothetical protein